MPDKPPARGFHCPFKLPEGLFFQCKAVQALNRRSDHIFPCIRAGLRDRSRGRLGILPVNHQGLQLKNSLYQAVGNGCLEKSLQGYIHQL